MESFSNHKIGGDFILCNIGEIDNRHADLFKFLWARKGSIKVKVDHIAITVNDGEIISLTPVQHLEIISTNGDCVALLFNSNFYCIYGHDNEVSCSGLLFHGSSMVIKLILDIEEQQHLNEIILLLNQEFYKNDSLKEEMLRILLKQFIIVCTRNARRIFSIEQNNEKGFDIVRQFYVLVDNNFRTKKQVKEYADMLFKSPKTLSNIFSEYKLQSPLKIIHERIESESKRLLAYTNKSAKEIGDILGFDDVASFSRFFKKMSGQNISDFRKMMNRE